MSVAQLPEFRSLFLSCRECGDLSPLCLADRKEAASAPWQKNQIWLRPEEPRCDIRTRYIRSEQTSL